MNPSPRFTLSLFRLTLSIPVPGSFLIRFIFVGADQRFFLERGLSLTSHITDGLRKQNFIAHNKWRAYDLLNNEVDFV